MDKLRASVRWMSVPAGESREGAFPADRLNQALLRSGGQCEAPKLPAALFSDPPASVPLLG
jgi:hypothetical protein